MADVLYLDTAAVLRALLETGTSPELERRIGSARALVTSRLSHVEAARAFLRLRAEAAVSEECLADAQRAVDALWARCETWELTASVCDAAATVAPHAPLRTLDALHLATYVLARRRLPGLELVTTDDRLENAARAI
ncbi:MAG: type II toxin-antitoxin system VapC family toxin [Gemmatimonadetes bacterium]|nr:type II toxin-antitoxin system VapC family toxin [Gemmatimonadota bacterium]